MEIGNLASPYPIAHQPVTPPPVQREGEPPVEVASIPPREPVVDPALGQRVDILA